MDNTFLLRVENVILPSLLKNTFMNMSKNIYIVFLLFSLAGMLTSCKDNNSGQEGPEFSDTLLSKAPSEVLEIGKEISKDSDNPELYVKRADAWARKKYFKQAVQDIEFALKLDSTLADFHYKLGIYAFEDNQVNKSVTALEKALSLNANYMDAKFKLAEIYTILKQYEKAIGFFEQLIEKEPSNPDNYYWIARNYKEKGDTVRALAYFQKTVDLDNDYYDAWIFMGEMYANNNDPRALPYFDAALRIKELSIEALYKRALLYQNLKNYPKAVEDYQKITDINPANPLAYYNIGYINFQLNQMERANEYFKKACEADESYSDAFYMRGLCAEIMGDKISAYEHYTYVVDKLDPNHELSKEGLNRIKPRKVKIK